MRNDRVRPVVTGGIAPREAPRLDAMDMRIGPGRIDIDVKSANGSHARHSRSTLSDGQRYFCPGA